MRILVSVPVTTAIARILGWSPGSGGCVVGFQVCASVSGKLVFVRGRVTGVRCSTSEPFYCYRAASGKCVEGWSDISRRREIRTVVLKGTIPRTMH